MWPVDWQSCGPGFSCISILAVKTDVKIAGTYLNIKITAKSTLIFEGTWLDWLIGTIPSPDSWWPRSLQSIFARFCYLDLFGLIYLYHASFTSYSFHIPVVRTHWYMNLRLSLGLLRASRTEANLWVKWSGHVMRRQFEAWVQHQGALFYMLFLRVFFQTTKPSSFKRHGYSSSVSTMNPL